MRLEKRVTPSRVMVLGSPLIALLLTLIAGALLFAALGRPPVATLYSFFVAPVRDWYGVSELLLKVTPLLLCAVGLSLCYRAQVWNIGAEGQFLMGALVGGATALQLNDASGFWVLPTIILAGVLGGMLWGAIAAVLKEQFRCNEILTTIMLNYIALHGLLYAVHGPLKDPYGFNFPESALFSSAASLPTLHEFYRTNIALIFALMAVVALWVLNAKTLVGFQVKVLGAAPSAARFAGFGTKGLVLLVMVISGGLAGLAGVSEVTGPVGQLIPHLSVGYGYAAIIVVFMGRQHPLGMLFASLLLGLTYLGGESIQIDFNLPKAITLLFQGMLLFFLLVTDLLITHRVRFNSNASHLSTRES